MKIKILSLFTFLSTLFYYSQDSVYSQSSLEENVRNYDSNRNIIKTNVTAYLFKNINVTYERVINKKFSISATYSFIPSSKVSFVDTFLKSDNLGDIKNIDMSYSSFTLEPRIYLGKKGFGRGFYIAPYYRYSKIDLKNYRYTYKTEVIVAGNVIPAEMPVDITADVSAHSFGLMIGNQWVLGKKENWVIDFSILGGHYGSSSGNLSAKSVNNLGLSPQNQADLQKELNNLDIPLVKIHATANNNGADAKIDGPWAGLRFGLSVGYKF